MPLELRLAKCNLERIEPLSLKRRIFFFFAPNRSQASILGGEQQRSAEPKLMKILSCSSHDVVQIAVSESPSPALVIA